MAETEYRQSEADSMERPAPPATPFTAAEWNAFMQALSAWEVAQRQAAPAATQAEDEGRE